jgi:replicative DNA helicase
MDDVKQITFSPQTASRLSLEMVEAIRNNTGAGIKTGLPDLDKIYVPDRPGELITILGRPSNYKSGFMNWLSKQALKSIPQGSDEIVIRATWEQSVEEDTLSWLAGDTGISITQIARGAVGDAEFTQLQKSAVKRAATPMYIIGHSKMQNSERRMARPRMTMHDLTNGIEYICNDMTASRWKPKAIFLDYLQRIRPAAEDGHDRRIQMMNIVDQAKDLAISFSCPVYLGVQATREVDKKETKIPDMDDGQETSNIEQSSDKSFGLWYPIKTEKENELVGEERVTKNLLVLRLLKQKLGEAPATFALYVDPERNIIGGREMLAEV